MATAEIPTSALSDRERALLLVPVLGGLVVGLLL